MGPRRPQPTLADYVVIALSPALIMVLVGSLCFFLLEVGYRGQWEGRLAWILFWFIMAAVLIARIAMEEGGEKATLYGLALGGAVALVLPKFIANPVIAWLLMGLAWWCANKLTWDCTLVDENQDASGEGLLQVAGLELNEPPAAEPKADDAAGPSKRRGQTAPKATATDAKPGTDSSRDKTPDSNWLERWYQHMRDRRNRPHAPGVWVVYFSLAALPLFGLGQALIPAGDVARRRYAFLLLFWYVASALGLLLTTSFLGLRRYLRQRKLEMPAAMTGAWMIVGAAMIVALLFAAVLLPRPSPEYEVEDLLALRSKNRQASNYAVLRDSPAEGEGRPSNQSSEQPPQPQSTTQPGSSGQQQTSSQPQSPPASSQSSQSSSASDSSQRNSEASGASSNGDKASQPSSQSPKGQSQAGQQGSEQPAKQPSQQPGQESGQQSAGQQQSDQQKSGTESGDNSRSQGGQNRSDQGKSDRGSSDNKGASKPNSPSGNDSPQNSQGTGQNRQATGQNSQGPKQPNPSNQTPDRSSGSADGNGKPDGTAKQAGSNGDKSGESPAEKSRQQRPGGANSQGGSSPDVRQIEKPQGAKSDTQTKEAQSNQADAQTADEEKAAEEKKQEEKEKEHERGGLGPSQRQSSSPKQPSAQQAPTKTPSRGMRVPDVRKWLPASFSRLFVYLVLIVVAIYVFIWHREKVLAFLRDMLAELKSIWQGLFGPKRTPVAEDAAPVAAPPRPFAAFPNPFATGAARRASPAELVRYTFEAVQAWAWERGAGRDPDETPIEFARALGRRLPGMSADLRDLADLYSQVTYARGTLGKDSLRVLRRLWDQLRPAVAAELGR